MVSEKLRSCSTLFVVLTFVAAVAIPASPAQAEHEGEAAERAAREILDARDRANEAAQAMFDAESRLDTLSIELASAEDNLTSLETEVDELRVALTESAVRQYTGAGQSPLLVFQETGRTNELARGLVYAGAATGSGLVQTDEYEQAIHVLDEARKALEQRRAETIEAGETWAALKSDAEEQVVALQRIEEERLADAQVQHALERQRKERAEQEQQAQAQEAARRAAASAAADAAAAKASSGGSSGSGNDGNAASSGGGSGSPTPQPAPIASPTPTPAPASNAGAGMACPVAGPRSFADTWGAPRSGGRSHEGVDMMAPGGTPLVAVESGSATFKTNRLGGNAVWITGASGTKYYYAHLSAWEGSSRSVSRGEVIGYVGSTGNTSVNHLHFEVHPNGGSAVNPYPYVRGAC